MKLPFIKRAHSFLSNPKLLRTHRYYNAMYDTVDYLLNCAVGIQNAKSTDVIISHLRNKGHHISRSAWQINVLGPLRDNGIFVAAKPGIGIFIIETINDAKKAVTSMEHRINVEKNRLQILKQIASQAGWKI